MFQAYQKISLLSCRSLVSTYYFNGLFLQSLAIYQLSPLPPYFLEVMGLLGLWVLLDKFAQVPGEA